MYTNGSTEYMSRYLLLPIIDAIGVAVLLARDFRLGCSSIKQELE